LHSPVVVSITGDAEEGMGVLRPKVDPPVVGLNGRVQDEEGCEREGAEGGETPPNGSECAVIWAASQGVVEERGASHDIGGIGVME
jgi:hypothetical protein